MEFRTRSKRQEFFYRKHIDSLIKHADPKGAVVYKRASQFDKWQPIGAIANGRYFDGGVYVDAMQLFRRSWGCESKYVYLNFCNIIKTGVVTFIKKHCGLDNAMSLPRSLRALKEGPNHYRLNPASNNYEYVVTDYGYELAGIIKQHYLQTVVVTMVKPTAQQAWDTLHVANDSLEYALADW